MKKVTLSAVVGVAALLATPVFAHQHESSHDEYHATFTKLGEGKPIIYTGRPIYQHVKAGDLPSEIGLFEEILPAKSLGAPPHTHTNEDEIFIVLDGTVHFLNGTDEVIAESGTVASLPRNNQHGFWNPYDEPAQLLVMVAPGHFQEFFGAVEAAVTASGAKSPQDIGAIIGREAAKKGVIIDMSALPPSALALLPPPSQ
ncbi:MAG: cupin domain-containing protein [Pseudomonadota bacterium]|nr:cupin domain-containing protein [Pseudomonadota bacterium]